MRVDVRHGRRDRLLATPLGKNRGVFTIELAIIAIFMSGLLVFTADVVVKQSIRGMLDRMSYSAVSVLKERTQLYNGSALINAAQVGEVDHIVQQSLSRTLPNFDPARYSALYQQYHFTDDNSGNRRVDIRRGINHASCQPPLPLTRNQAEQLSPITNEGRRSAVYEVTLCYRTDNWFGQLMNETYEWVASNSIIIGR